MRLAKRKRRGFALVYALLMVTAILVTYGGTFYVREQLDEMEDASALVVARQMETIIESTRALYMNYQGFLRNQRISAGPTLGSSTAATYWPQSGAAGSAGVQYTLDTFNSTYSGRLRLKADETSTGTDSVLLFRTLIAEPNRSPNPQGSIGAGIVLSASVKITTTLPNNKFRANKKIIHKLKNMISKKPGCVVESWNEKQLVVSVVFDSFYD